MNSATKSLVLVPYIFKGINFKGKIKDFLKILGIKASNLFNETKSFVKNLKDRKKKEAFKWWKIGYSAGLEPEEIETDGVLQTFFESKWEDYNELRVSLLDKLRFSKLGTKISNFLSVVKCKVFNIILEINFRIEELLDYLLNKLEAFDDRLDNKLGNW